MKAACICDKSDGIWKEREKLVVYVKQNVFRIASTGPPEADFFPGKTARGPRRARILEVCRLKKMMYI